MPDLNDLQKKDLDHALKALSVACYTFDDKYTAKFLISKVLDCFKQNYGIATDAWKVTIDELIDQTLGGKK